MSKDCRTVHDLAQDVRRRCLEAYGEAPFARMCMEFDQSIDHAVVPCDEEGDPDLAEGDEGTARVIGVMHKLAHEALGVEGVKMLQIGLVWLDGHGIGHLKVDVLGVALEEIRQGGYRAE